MGETIDNVSQGEVAEAVSVRRRRRRRSETRLKNEVQTLKRGLVSTVLALVVVLVGAGWGIVRVAQERDALASRYARANAELDEIKAELSGTNARIAEIVQGRFPNLLSVELDRVVSFNSEHVRTVTLTRVGDERKWDYEYHVVFHNKGSETVAPVARLLLFDTTGMQVGSGAAEIGELGPGEVRSQTGLADLVSHAVPQYFAVETDSGMLAAQ